MASQPDTPRGYSAALVVINPSGNRRRVPLSPLPFLIGRQADNQLVLRDNRISRVHARIESEGDGYVIEDLNSRHGIFVNNERITRRRLSHSDRIEFGIPDSYKLIFTQEDQEMQRILDQLAATPLSPSPGAGNLAKLRALVEVARSLQNSLSVDDVLISVVDAALAITGAERGFLLLRDGEDLDVRVARDRGGAALTKDDLRVPTKIIHRALESRRELLSMRFDPQEEREQRPDATIAFLELRSVVCVPLVRVRTHSAEDTLAVTTLNDTVGVLYMDSRRTSADLSAGNRELLTTLALEASTILENARLLEEERAKQRMDEELRVARAIQSSLLPRSLPSTGWFRACGSSIPSQQVGGDYYDVRAANPDTWSAMIADVSGKGVSSALLASLLQGAFLVAGAENMDLATLLKQVNLFLLERTEGEKYATLFHFSLNRNGQLRYANAAHPEPVLIRSTGAMEQLSTTSVPVGLLEQAEFAVNEIELQPGDKIVAFTDGLTEAQNGEGAFFDRNGFREALVNNAALDCSQLHNALRDAVHQFTEGAPQSDDITILVVEYNPK